MPGKKGARGGRKKRLSGMRKAGEVGGRYVHCLDCGSGRMCTYVKTLKSILQICAVY